jgi:hypothetical protein
MSLTSGAQILVCHLLGMRESLDGAGDFSEAGVFPALLLPTLPPPELCVSEGTCMGPYSDFIHIKQKFHKNNILHSK